MSVLRMAPCLRGAQRVTKFHYAHYELIQLLRNARLTEGIADELENTIVRLTPHPPRSWNYKEEADRDELLDAGVVITVACDTPESLKKVRLLLNAQGISTGPGEDEKSGYKGSPESRARARAISNEAGVRSDKRQKQTQRCTPGQAGSGAGKGGRGGK